MPEHAAAPVPGGEGRPSPAHSTEGARPPSLEIRRATADDAEAVSALIKGVAHFFTLHPQGLGAEAFLRSIEPEAVRGYVTSPEFRYDVGCIEGRLAGVVAIRNNAHLFHLFVDPAFQNRGVGRALWRQASQAAVARGNHAGFTVNATPNAVPVYERLGFKPAGARVETSGIAFVPMALPLADRGPSPEDTSWTP